MFFFFKQKTAYEIKECDWSSDVCSSDLVVEFRSCAQDGEPDPAKWQPFPIEYKRGRRKANQIGRASCRERV